MLDQTKRPRRVEESSSSLTVGAVSRLLHWLGTAHPEAAAVEGSRGLTHEPAKVRVIVKSDAQISYLQSSVEAEW